MGPALFCANLVSVPPEGIIGMYSRVPFERRVDSRVEDPFGRPLGLSVQARVYPCGGLNPPIVSSTLTSICMAPERSHQRFVQFAEECGPMVYPCGGMQSEGTLRGSPPYCQKEFYCSCHHCGDRRGEKREDGGERSEEAFSAFLHREDRGAEATQANIARYMSRIIERGVDHLHTVAKRRIEGCCPFDRQLEISFREAHRMITPRNSARGLSLTYQTHLLSSSIPYSAALRSPSLSPLSLPPRSYQIPSEEFLRKQIIRPVFRQPKKRTAQPHTHTRGTWSKQTAQTTAISTPLESALPTEQ
jgi:hypothetical protein